MKRYDNQCSSDWKEIDNGRFYKADEADAVIAEQADAIAELRRMLIKCRYHMDTEPDGIEELINKHKVK